MKRKIRLTLALCISLPALLFSSSNSQEHEVSALKISERIHLDGKLDEKWWNEAQVISGFIQREPREGEPATERTEVRILYDNDNLYIGIVCFDSQPAKIVANEMRRDAELLNNDFFQILIDTYHDHRNAFFFIINPLGAKRDALIREEGSSVNWDWEGIWDVRTARDSRGWTAEVALPFTTLRFKKDREQTWGINFGRHVARKREESFWAPVLRAYGWFGYLKVSYFGHLTGLVDVKQGKKAQFMPYIIGGAGQHEDDNALGWTGDAGLDLKYSITSNITADVTLNTDFAQVEADQEQFNLSRFSLFFPEKRGFFLEGADIFRFGERYREMEPPETLFFFSRTIGLSEDREVPIIGGLKVTGKSGPYDLGFLHLYTDKLSYEEDGETVTIDRTSYSVLRFKRDFLKKSTLGLMFLGKQPQGGHNYNRGLGFDFNLAFGPSLQIGGFLAKTITPDLSGKDWAADLNFGWWGDFLIADFSYTDIGENFNAEMGFIRRADIRKLRANVGIGPRPNILNIRQSFFFANLLSVENHAGELESRSLLFGNFNFFQDGSNLFVGYVQNYELLSSDFEISTDVFIPQGIYKFNQLVAFYESDKSRNISLRGETYYGQFYNGRLFKVTASGFLKLSKNFNMEFIYDCNQFNLPIEGGRFTTNIAVSRIIYSFTPDLFAKAFLQWNDSDGIFSTNFLLRWIYKPGASVYLVYNETRMFGEDARLLDRALMLKVSFLFNF